MTNPRVLLTTLSARTSAKGRRYLAGWLGKASVVAFEGQPDKWGNPTWDVYLSEPEPREAGHKASTRPPERDPGSRREWGLELPAHLLEPPGGLLAARARRLVGIGRPSRWCPPTGPATAISMIRCPSEPPQRRLGTARTRRSRRAECGSALTPDRHSWRPGTPLARVLEPSSSAGSGHVLEPRR
jgi:hypothetical protein